MNPFFLNSILFQHCVSSILYIFFFFLGIPVLNVTSDLHLMENDRIDLACTIDEPSLMLFPFNYHV